MTPSMHVLIVDDQPRARQSLRALLATLPFLASIQEASDGEQALACIEKSIPDVVITDVRMPGMDGLTVTRAIKARWPNVTVIVLSLYREYSEEALTAGANVFLCKGEPPARLIETLSAAL